MSVASMLENMKRRALDSTYDAYICEEYDAWAVESFATEEGEYDAARLELPKVLSSEQMEKLKTMEERYQQNRKYGAELERAVVAEEHGHQSGREAVKNPRNAVFWCGDRVI